jgi:hypothetical protein
MSTFCTDCKHRKNTFLNFPKCELTRVHHVDQDTGRQWSYAADCSFIRTYRLHGRECPNFEQKPPTLIQRLKEVFS